VKKLLAIGISLFSLSVFAQKKPAVAISFPDSVRIVLENTKNIDATTVGAAFAGVWNNIGYDLQAVIKQHSKKIYKKGYRLRPEITNYFGAIADAINLEAADPEKLTSFLQVTSQVIDLEKRDQANEFFLAAREFFEHHSLHFDRSYKLYSRDDDFTFAYIPAEGFAPMEAQMQPDTITAWQTEPLPDTTAYDTTAYDTTVTYAPPMPPTTPPPNLTGPVIKFKRLSLVFSTFYDSAILTEAKGTYSLRDRIFVGEGGRFDWSTVGLSKDSVYFDFTAPYFFKVTKPEFKGEQGNMVYQGRTPGKVAGAFEFKSAPHKTQKDALWPRFTSFDNNIATRGLANPKLTFTGGFSMQGRKVASASLNFGLSTLELAGDSTQSQRFMVQAKSFDLQDSLIAAKQAAVWMYQGSDVLTHPAIDFRYDITKDKILLSKSKSNLKDAPFSSSYFNVDFSSDQIRWDLKNDSLNLYTAGGVSQSPMVIESVDHFDYDDFKLLVGVGFSFHPLMLAAGYAKRYGTTSYNVGDVAQRYQKDVNEIKRAMSFLSSKGMVEYNSANGSVVVKEKARHIAESFTNDSDFDNLKIHSIIHGAPNSSISFKKGEMLVRGVEDVNVSDSLNFSIKPDSGIITILKNRDIKFNGKITAGNFEIRGKEFTFKYDSFLINLTHIDSIRFYVVEKNARGQKVRKLVNNALVSADSAAAAAGGMDVSANSQKKSGTLFINLADNKSGKMDIPNFPNLDASGGGVIYFDRKEVLNGVYGRSIFFVVPPFKLDSLSDADPASINFDGTFGSKGMFPNFKDKLHTMPDQSLGFIHPTPADGYQLFKGDGKFTGTLNLDGRGLRGDGEIDYLAATLKSTDFIFYPDSVTTRGTVGEIAERQLGPVWFPQMTLPEYRLKWVPKNDRFDLRNVKNPFNFYAGTAQLNGRLTINSKGVSGGGRLNTLGSEVLSNNMSFSAKEFSARNARFQVKTDNPQKPALAGRDVRVHFYLDKNYAEISPEVRGTAAINFPYAQFRTSIPTARWDLNTQKILMTKDPDVPIEDSYFYTTRKDLDSLSFNATQAEYDIKTQQLKVSGIPYITVADARITPQNNEVLILENAKIGQLTNTVIVLDTLNGYHRLTDGVVDIISRKQFTGYATYQYVNALSDTFAIKMTDFGLEAIAPEEIQKKRRNDIVATQQTVAHGAVTEEEELLLAPRIFYKGDMVMYATRPALRLKGYAKLDLKNIKGYDTWLAVDRSGDEAEFYLDFDNTITEEGKKADAGLHFTPDNRLYVAFVTEKRNDDDEDFFKPAGSLFYDTAGNEFKIEDRDKARGDKLSGKVLAYNEEKQEVRFEGPVTFFKALPDFSVGASVIGSGNIETNDIKMNALVTVDMKLPEQVIQLMAQNIAEIIKNETVEEGGGDHTELLYKVANVVGEKIAKDYETRSLQNYFPLANVPGLAKPMVFSNVDMKFSQQSAAFYSIGNLGLSNLGRVDINGAFEGFMEAKRTEDGSPIFHVFIKASPEAWYYFGYEDHRLMVHTSNSAINDIMSKKTNAAKAKVGELVYIPGSDDETLAFINRFRKEYLEIDSPYDLSATSTKAKEKDEKKKADDGF
jgi:hypothetical protein